MINRDRLLERFLRYVVIATTSDPDADCYPSSAGQWELGKLLVDELVAMGLEGSRQDDHGLVWATLESNSTTDVPTIAWNAHLDTSPETSGENVKPQVVDDYPGGDLQLPGDPKAVIRVAENPELEQLLGCTLVTTDGTTLLGGDDKAGIAIIMEAIQSLLENPEIVHGRIQVLFTCDEEIGHGVDFVDMDRLAAVAAYTVDGGQASEIDVETFSADLATITIQGVNIHPSIARDRMVNAMRAAGCFLDRLPREMAPETTDGRAGFIHPYSMVGGVAEVTIQLILRDFETEQLAVQQQLLRALSEQISQECPGITIDVTVISQYRNMAKGLSREPRAVAYAQQAHERLGRVARMTTVRGGTDGSQLTEKGLPTPNLSSGQHNPHSPLEWACLDEMIQAVEVLVELAQVWAGSSVQPDKND
jgi:tripeptide aminopeptidase